MTLAVADIRRRQLELGIAPRPTTPECIACDMGDHVNCGGDYEEVPCGCWCAAEAAR